MFTTAVQDGCLFSTPSPAFTDYGFFDDGHSDCCEVIVVSTVVLISLIISAVDHLFI